MTRSTPLLALVPFVLLSSLSLRAQTVATDHVVGWVPVPNARTTRIELQDVRGGCKAARTMCPSRLLMPSEPHAGATAYDPRTQAVWVSDGRVLQRVALAGCREACATKLPLRDPKAVVTGLAISDAARLMWHLESRPGYFGFVLYDLRKCPPAPLRGGCSGTLAPLTRSAALAHDEPRGLLYYTESTPALVGWANAVVVARPGAPCKAICRIPLGFCNTARDPLFLVTGLAYDACSRVLYATDGQSTVTLRMDDPLRCRVTRLGCCKKQTRDRFAGLAVVPGWRSRAVGKSCTGSGCRSCPGMRAGLAGGDPSLGNGDFAATLSGAPDGGQAFFVLGAGTCGAGVTLPILCGKIYPRLSPQPAVLGPFPLGGGTGCSGAARAALPIPVDPSLCGAALCAQWAVLCGAPPRGLGLSGAVEFTVAGT